MNPQAGRELDALVAEKVMGEPQPVADPGNGPWRIGDPPLRSEGGAWECLHFYEHGDVPEWHPRPYSTDIAAAWEVVEKMRHDPRPRFCSLSMVAYCYYRTYATFDAEAFIDYTPETWAEANGEHSTPLAICLAALKAVEAPVQK